MGSITEGVLGGLQLREQRRRNDFAEASQIAELQQRRFMAEQQMQMDMLKQRDQLSQHYETMRDRITNDHAMVLDKLENAQKALQTVRAQANSEMLKLGKPMPLTAQALSEAVNHYSALSQVATRQHGEIQQIDQRLEGLYALVGPSVAQTRYGGFGVGKSTGGGGLSQESVSTSVGETPADEAQFASGMTEPMKFDADGIKSLLVGERLPSPSLREDGQFEITAYTDEDAKDYQDRIDDLEKLAGQQLGVVIKNRNKDYEAATADLARLDASSARNEARISGLEVLKTTPSDIGALQDALKLASASGDDSASVYQAAINARDSDRVGILQREIDRIRQLNEENSKIRNSAREIVEEKYRAMGAGVLIGDIEPQDIPSGMSALEFESWMRKQFKKKNKGEPSFNDMADAWMRYVENNPGE